MKKIFIIQLFLFVLVQQIFAYDIEINGIYYDLKDSCAIVAYKDTKYNSYSGDIVIPQSIIYENKEYKVSEIGYRAFYQCINLTSISLPDGLEDIHVDAFSHSGIKSLEIPNSVKGIGPYAFSGMTNLEEIIFPEELERIEYGVLSMAGTNSYNRKLTKVVMPKKCSYIDKMAFCNQSKLESIDLPEGLESIDEMAFYYCASLKNAELPSSVTFIGKEALAGTPIPINQIPSSMKILAPYAFYEAYGLTELTIPDYITDIPTTCFSKCKNLKSINLSNVESIGAYAFATEINLEAILLPKSIKKIEDGAFVYNRKLQSVFSLSKEPASLGKEVFNEAPEDIKLYVPTGCTDAYKAAGWGEYFSEIIEMDEVSQRAAFAKSVTGVTTVIAPSKTNSGYFNLQGQKLDAPQKGINILRTEDGTTKKVYVR